jgi:PadR family transcriptional regulator, regulatory protein AphA
MLRTMSRDQLTPVAYLVLGLVELTGGATVYELKQTVAGSVGFLWSFSHSQIYAEAAALAEAGLLAEEQEESGRRRRRYTITPAGRKELVAWLREPVDVAPEVRDLGLLKLFFGGLVSRDDVVALARAQEEGHRARLALYEGMERRISPDDEWPHAVATLRMGLLFERAFVRFWSEIRERPPGAGG